MLATDDFLATCWPVHINAFFFFRVILSEALAHNIPTRKLCESGGRGVEVVAFCGRMSPTAETLSERSESNGALLLYQQFHTNTTAELALRIRPRLLQTKG